MEVKYKEFTLDIPDWVKFIAQDRSGAGFCYEFEPLRMDEFECWDTMNHGRFKLVKTGWKCPPSEDWKESLINLKSTKEVKA